MDYLTNETFWVLAGAFIFFMFSAYHIDKGSKERLETIERCFNDDETDELALGKAQNLELIRAKLELISMLLGAILIALIYMLMN